MKHRTINTAKLSQYACRVCALARALGGVIIVMLGLLAAAPTHGVINPKFTPKELLRDSERICVAVLERPDAASPWGSTSVSDIKGRTPPFHLDWTSIPATDLASFQALLSANGSAPVLAFSAKTDGGWKAFLHIDGEWIALKGKGEDTWLIESRAPQLSGTWAGGTDMLIRQVRFLMAHPGEDVPVRVGMSWVETHAELGQLDAPPAGLSNVELPGYGLCIFAALPTGDRLFRAKPTDEAFEEITASVKLATRSRHVAWADLNGDGRLDLASWDGEVVSLWHLSTPGVFERLDGGKGFPYPGGCLGLNICARHRDGAAAVLVSGTTNTCLLRYAGSNWQAESLSGGPDRANPSVAPAVVADLDGDGWWDLLQIQRTSSLLWKGGPGGLSRPSGCKLAAQSDTCRWALGDFNQDGFLDIFLAGEKGNALWENNGRSEFHEVTRRAGSLSYKLPAGVSDCLAADLNHDGRTDLCLFYRQSTWLYHFNRGFRCFGEEGELRLLETQAGQHTGAVGDFNSDGSLDLVVALADGRLRCYYNRALEQPMLRLGMKPNLPSPIAVSVWAEGVTEGSQGTFLVLPPPARTVVTLRNKGPVRLKWPVPGGGERQQVITLPNEIPMAGVETVLTP